MEENLDVSADKRALTVRNSILKQLRSIQDNNGINYLNDMKKRFFV